MIVKKDAEAWFFTCNLNIERKINFQKGGEPRQKLYLYKFLQDAIQIVSISS